LGFVLWSSSIGFSLGHVLGLGGFMGLRSILDQEELGWTLEWCSYHLGF